MQWMRPDRVSERVPRFSYRELSMQTYDIVVTNGKVERLITIDAYSKRDAVSFATMTRCRADETIKQVSRVRTVKSSPVVSAYVKASAVKAERASNAHCPICGLPTYDFMTYLTQTGDVCHGHDFEEENVR